MSDHIENRDAHVTSAMVKHVKEASWTLYPVNPPADSYMSKSNQPTKLVMGITMPVWHNMAQLRLFMSCVEEYPVMSEFLAQEFLA